MELDALAADWLEFDQDPVTRKEIEDLVSNKDYEALQSCLYPRISFGTAGLRARIGAGFARMNGLVVIQTSQGLAQHFIDTDKQAKEKGVVVGHDARHQSQYFANLAASAFLAKGLKVSWLGQVHTPLVPFTVKRLEAAGGVMITASHNPKEDNGYKVYAGNSCQINQPEDGQIAAAIFQNLRPLSWITDVAEKVNNVQGDSISAYNQAIAKRALFRENETIRFVYTPLHGVGFKYMAGAFAETRSHLEGVKEMEVVAAQVTPDPDFPTVKFPNPEEDGALDLAKETADNLGIDLIIANDPDADRFAAAEKVDGKWHVFKGDELGVLIGYFYFSNEPEKMKSKTILTSAVSSQMLEAIAQVEGFTVEETLTGFKWIGNRARELGTRVPFGYEEALGYMLPQIVFDKDGVAAAMMFLEMCTYLGSPYKRLQQLYSYYGFFETLNTYWKSPSIEMTAAIMKKIQEDPTMIKPLGATPGKTRVRDLMAGTDTGMEDGKARLWSGPDNQMITVWHSGEKVFRDGVRYTIRASGTEPKIKVYIECKSTMSAEDAEAGAQAVFRTIGKTWFSDPAVKVEERYRPLLDKK